MLCFCLNRGLWQRIFCSFPFILCFFCRFLPYLIPASEAEGEAGPDLSTLRTFRVLRPLKLVSGVPSKRFYVSYRTFLQQGVTILPKIFITGSPCPVRFYHFLSRFEIYARKSKSRHRIERSNIENVFEVLFACVNFDWRHKFSFWVTYITFETQSWERRQTWGPRPRAPWGRPRPRQRLFHNVWLKLRCHWLEV